VNNAGYRSLQTAKSQDFLNTIYIYVLLLKLILSYV